MKIVRLLLSLVVFLQAVIVLHGQITAAASSHADHGGFPIPSEYNRGQAGGAVASGQMRAAIASVPFFLRPIKGRPILECASFPGAVVTRSSSRQKRLCWLKARPFQAPETTPAVCGIRSLRPEPFCE